MHATAFNTYSDAVLKTDVANVDLSPVFDTVNAMSYMRSDKPGLGRRVGFFAQDVRGACSSAGVPDTFTSEIEQEYGGKLLAMDYARMVCVAFSKIKRLEARRQAIEQAIENA